MLVLDFKFGWTPFKHFTNWQRAQKGAVSLCLPLVLAFFVSLLLETIMDKVICNFSPSRLTNAFAR